MEARNLQDEEAIPHTKVKSTTKQNGMISNSSFTTNDLSSFPIQVAEMMSDVMQPLTSQTMLITPPEDGYVTPDTEPILIELEKDLGSKVIYTTVNNKEANEAWKPITQQQHRVFISTNPSVNLGKVSRKMKSPLSYDFNLSFPYNIDNSRPFSVYCYFHPHLISSEGMNTLLLVK